MKRVIDALTPEEAAVLKDSFTGVFATRNRCLAELLLNTGLRISEALALNISDVFDGLFVKDAIYVRPETAKRKKARYIPLNRDAQSALWDVLKFNREHGYPLTPDDPLFASQRPNAAGVCRLCPQAFQHIIRRIRKSMDVAITVTPHIFRHTFITRIYRATTDIRIAQELAGHSDISTTSLYTHKSREEKRHAVGLIDGFDPQSGQSNRLHHEKIDPPSRHSGRDSSYCAASSYAELAFEGVLCAEASGM